MKCIFKMFKHKLVDCGLMSAARKHTNTTMVFEPPDPSGPGAFWPSDASCVSVAAPENSGFQINSAARASKTLAPSSRVAA